MDLWDSAASDCYNCLALSNTNFKAHYYLSIAQLGLKNFTEALEHAKRAHELCVAAGDKSLAIITTQVLKCKTEGWNDQERRRRRETTELESEVTGVMGGELARVLDATSDEGVKKEIQQEWEQKMLQLQRIFEMARAAEERRRTIPEWAVDDISFNVMVDPVIVS